MHVFELKLRNRNSMQYSGTRLKQQQFMGHPVYNVKHHEQQLIPH